MMRYLGLTFCNLMGAKLNSVQDYLPLPWDDKLAGKELTEEEVDIREESRNYNKLKKMLKEMKQNEVYVGITDDTTEREEQQTKEVTNAELLFIHTNGSPIRNIPPRPVIEPAIRNDKDRLSRMMKQAAQLFLKGDKQGAINQLRKVGMRGQNVSRAWFVNPENGWPPNSPAVQAAKMKKGANIPRPLIDTGEMRKSITYFVRTKGGRTK